MCYLCSCFTWTLDLIQRILTFFLSCWLAYAVCCGLGVAIIAGIAYGYNYCLAEYIVLTRSDVSVYMRRGQFYDKPDLYTKNSRRSGDNDDEYQQEVPHGDDSLSGQWEKDQEIRKYAEKLTKYSDSRNNIVVAEQNDKHYQRVDPSEDDPVLGQWNKNQDKRNYSSQRAFVDSSQLVNVPKGSIFYKLTSSSPRQVSNLTNPYISTSLLQSGSSEIVMRMFEPVSNIVPEPRDSVEEYDDKPDIGLRTDMNITELEVIERKTIATPDIRTQHEDNPTRRLITIRPWGSSPKPIIMEYSLDVDEDNGVYKAV
ncbi:uncharacterized protein LOC120628783 [Pararge aegeria]|uniref:uncharacterized protein LOC120628783 n=1 Tax=Pararge aegeria TaxID=116150 RepID=UPI0019D2DE50|nr:uncharacterized protein LOC120628783 [Pararge aegeria]